jgi:crotonobetainyl-CoA:carnitine CoA-transferase CaiB-like acyl-CoA transferase
VPTAAYRMSDNPMAITALPPRLGQHTDAVLAACGYTPAEIAALHSAGTV